MMGRPIERVEKWRCRAMLHQNTVRLSWVLAIAIWGCPTMRMSTENLIEKISVIAPLFTHVKFLTLLQRTLRHDRVLQTSEFPGTVSRSAAKKTADAYFDFAVREIHNGKCGGAAETRPAIDCYGVNRHSGKIQQWEAAEDKWQPYRPLAK
jgi:hypothetical protein